MTETKTENSGRSDLGRALKAIDEIQEGAALLNYMLSKRTVREALSPEVVVQMVEQTNGIVTSVNAAQVTLDALVPRTTKRLSMNVGDGELRAAPDAP